MGQILSEGLQKLENGEDALKVVLEKHPVKALLPAVGL